MAKQRPSSRVAPKKASKAPAARTTRPAPKAARAIKAARPASATAARRAAPPSAAKKNPAPAVKKAAAPARKTAAPVRKPAPAVPPHVTDRNLAVELFEKGFASLQQRRFKEAAQLFNAVVAQYPDEKELIERTRVYLAVCARQVAPADATPKTFDERLYAATLAVNRGAHDEGLAQLTSLEREQPEHDHIQYLLAVVRAQRGEADTALAHLQKAITLRPSLRLQAGTDTDLEPLHDNAAFNSLLDPAARPRPAGRERSGR